MVYTELAARRQLFHVAPAKQQPNNATILLDIQKHAIKKNQKKKIKDDTVTHP